MWESEGQKHGRNRGHSDDATIRQDVSKIDGFVRRDQSWYVTSEVPSDLLVQVGESSCFHLHKYPLLSRSGKMNSIIYEAEVSKIDVGDIPGGAESFELAAKFCYGIAVDLTASNISGLRCAAEYLEMTEDLEEGNLIFKTEAFLSYVVLSSWRDSIVVLKSCESLSPWAENLQIVRRCSESIAWKACSNPRGIRWAYTGKPPRSLNSTGAAAAFAGGSGGSADSKGSSPREPPETWWLEDVCLLRIDHFVRVVTAIKVKGLRPELIGAAITRYAAKWLPGLAKEGFASGEESGRWSGQGGLHIVVAGGGGGGGGGVVKDGDLAGCRGVGGREQRMVIESLISIIPPQKDCVPCEFLLRVLRLANMLKVAPALVTELEKRVGMQLEQASLPDLLIPSFGCSEAMYDVDLVQRLVEHFLVQENVESSSPEKQIGYEGGFGVPKVTKTTASTAPSGAKTRVARLLDSYLTEVSRDRNLSLTKFQVLAEALPDWARACDDGLYRAVDSYLKAHPLLSEHERKRLCRVMDCQKLSMDACMHAAQNERLPLRVVVQVLFSEQVKISNAVAAYSTVKDTTNANADLRRQYQPMMSTRKQLLDATPQPFQEGWDMAKKDINTLKFELESMKAKYLELQNDMDSLQRQFDKLTAASKPAKGSSGWSSGWKKLGRLKKTSGVEGNDAVGGSASTAPGAKAADQARKGLRRWRNSIS